MQVKTLAIVLHLAPHTDRASILHTYTRTSGRVPYMVYGVGSRRNADKKALCEPLTLVELDADHLETRQFQQLRDIHLQYVPQHLRTDMSRRCVALFVAEILSSTLLHPMTDELLFDFLAQTVRSIDTCDDPENEHLRFLMSYIDYLGFGMDTTLPDYRPFAVIAHLSREHGLSRELRHDLLHSLLAYYQKFLPDFREPKSLDILEQVFD